MGTILKMYDRLSSSATAARVCLASSTTPLKSTGGGGVSRSRSVPLIVHEAFDSPGWTRAVRKMYGRDSARRPRKMLQAQLGTMFLNEVEAKYKPFSCESETRKIITGKRVPSDKQRARG